MTLGAPIPFIEALRHLASRRTMPTSLTTAELQQLDGDILRGSLFSAQTTLVPYLDRMREVIRESLSPRAGIRRHDDGTPITEGMNLADGRLALSRELQRLGYRPDADKFGTIEDLGSRRRLDLVIETNVGISRGFGEHMESIDDDVLLAFPAQELYRAGEPKVRRDWQRRWRAAAQAVGDEDAIRILDEHGLMIARKDSPIWQALGDGAGLPEDERGDALHNPYAPFAFGSNMRTRDVSRSRSIELGVIRRDERVRVEAPRFPFADQADQADAQGGAL